MRSKMLRGHLAGLAVAAAVMAIGAPAAGAATISPTSHNFGNVTVGSSSTQTFTVTNGCGTFILSTCIIPEFTGIAPTVTPASYSLTNGCPALLATNGQTCGITVTFKPTAAGVANGTLTAGTGLSATLTGTGVVPATAPATAPARKKCKKKKKKGAASAKKCKRKK